MTRNVIDGTDLQAQLAGLRGRWVAIRMGHVVGHAASLGELIRDERVQHTDTRMLVPRPGVR